MAIWILSIALIVVTYLWIGEMLIGKVQRDLFYDYFTREVPVEDLLEEYKDVRWKLVLMWGILLPCGMYLSLFKDGKK